ncbi:MAG: fibronectin type III domain-containing protein [Elusimicrobia bacterium]|nr:fibronectin type III domain-containing protein [Elusimicrobiota bacterium]
MKSLGVSLLVLCLCGGALAEESGFGNFFGPAELEATSLSGTVVELKWNAPPAMGRQEFEVQRQEGEAPFRTVGKTEAPGFQDAAVEPGQRYAYRIRALDGFEGEAVFSKAVQVLTPQNLLLNPSFELGERGYRLPQEAQLDEANAYEGVRSVRLEAHRWESTSYIRAMPVRVEGERWYQSSLWMRTEGVKSYTHGAKALVSWFDGGKNFISREDVVSAVRGSQPWGFFTRTLQAPLTARYAVWYLCLHKARGSVWFDGLGFHPTAPPKELPGMRAGAAGGERQEIRDAVQGDLESSPRRP